jgi:D-lactate dehydrogenase (cytochrome)
MAALTRNFNSVPISKLPQLVYETQQDLERSGIVHTILGHAGDGKYHYRWVSRALIYRGGINPTTGNFHALLMFKTDEELNTVRGLVHRMVERALALDGTCKSPAPMHCFVLSREERKYKAHSNFFSLKGTGEHGVGMGKKGFLVEELGVGTVGLMKTIKRAIDPLGIMNPGKVRGSFVEPHSRRRAVLRNEHFSSTQTTRMHPTLESEGVLVEASIIVI